MGRSHHGPDGPQRLTFSSSADFNAGARVTGLPIYRDAGRRLLHLGFSGIYKSRDGTTFRFLRRPEIHLAKQYYDTGDLKSDGAGVIAVELAGVCGSFHFASEWKQTWIDETTLGRQVGFGGYVSAGYFLTGEHRPYQTSNATWKRVEPIEPFDPGKGQWGAFEIATRYSHLDLDRDELKGGSGQDISWALNWYLYSSLRISTNYVYADLKSTGVGADPTRTKGTVHAFQTRVQIEF